MLPIWRSIYGLIQARGVEFSKLRDSVLLVCGQNTQELVEVRKPHTCRTFGRTSNQIKKTPEEQENTGETIELKLLWRRVHQLNETDFAVSTSL